MTWMHLPPGSILLQHHMTNLSEQSVSVHDKIQKLIELIKPYILGGTPMCRALADVFSQTTATPKNLFLLSDGESADGDPREIARRLRDSNVTIVTCFLTSDNLENPRRLLDPQTKFQDRSGRQVLFNMSSSMKNTHTPVSYLTDTEWELPLSGESSLFVQATVWMWLMNLAKLWLHN